MFDHRATHQEMLDHSIQDNTSLRRNLDEMELINRWFGSKRLIINCMNKIAHRYPNYFKNNKIVIADLGCGNGDLLRSIDQWAKKNNFNLELIGFDIKPSVIHYAIQKSVSHPTINYHVVDILSDSFNYHLFDIIFLNNVCHHFPDITLIKLFKQLEKQVRLAVVINDLHRHWISYFSIKCLAKLCNFSDLAKNDGPLSVLKAFRKHELMHLLNQAHILQYQIYWVWAFHWNVIIWCQ